MKSAHFCNVATRAGSKQKHGPSLLCRSLSSEPITEKSQMAICPLPRGPYTLCSCHTALGHQLLHVIFRRNNKMVFPAGFANWMLLFQIKKKKKNTRKQERRPNHPPVERKKTQMIQSPFQAAHNPPQAGPRVGHISVPGNSLKLL